MKVKFSRESKYVPAWGGNAELPEAEQMHAIIKPLKVGDMMMLLDAMGKKIAPDGTQMTQDTVDTAVMLKQCGSLLPKYVEIFNLEDDDGPVKVDDLINYPRYMELAADLLMRCASVSMPDENAEGNLKEPRV